MKRDYFVNEFGNKEYYIVKELERTMSHHLNRGSATYTDYDCGNCDGALCHKCRPIFTVTAYTKPTFNEEFGCIETKIAKFSRFKNADEALAFYQNMV